MRRDVCVIAAWCFLAVLNMFCAIELCKRQRNMMGVK